MKKIIYIVLLASVFLFMPPLRGAIDTFNLNISLGFFAVALIVHLFQRNKNWFRLDIFFILGYAIFHFQWAAMLSIHDMTPQYPTFIMLRHYVNYGTWISVVGIIAWFFGYSFKNYKIEEKEKDNKFIFKIGYKKVFLFTMLLFALFVITAGRSYLNAELYKGGKGATSSSMYVLLLLSISTSILIVSVILNRNQKSKLLSWFMKSDKRVLGFIAIYALFFLYVGDRGGAIQVVFIFLTVFSSIVRPIVFKEFLLIVVSGAIILTFIGMGRGEDGDKNILEAGAEKTELNNGYDLTMELANSARTLYMSLGNIPKRRDYFYGKLWLSKALAIVPFSNSIYLKISKDKRYYISSSSYITYLRFGEYNKSGEGTSLVADIYLNFSLLGVLFFMFLLGIVIRRFQYELELNRNFYWIISAAIFSGFVFYISRDSLFSSVRAIIWGIIVAVLLVEWNTPKDLEKEKELKNV